jgi:hypothetical protein
LAGYASVFVGQLAVVPAVWWRGEPEGFFHIEVP